MFVRDFFDLLCFFIGGEKIEKEKTDQRSVYHHPVRVGSDGASTAQTAHIVIIDVARQCAHANANYPQPVFLDKIDDYAKKNYPLNRSDVVNLAISSTLTKIKGGYISKRGAKKDNVCFNIEKDFADKISDMATVDTKNSILIACIYEYFK